MKVHLSLANALALALLMLLAAGCASRQEAKISALHHFKKGNEAYRIEDYAGAIRHFTLALEKDETAAEVYYNLGLAYFKAGDNKQAVAAFNIALSLRPEMPNAHYNLALSHDKLYNAEAAHTHYNKYRELVSGQRPERPKRSQSAATPARLGAGAGRHAASRSGGIKAGRRQAVKRGGGAALKGRAVNAAGPRGKAVTGPRGKAAGTVTSAKAPATGRRVPSMAAGGGRAGGQPGRPAPQRAAPTPALPGQSAGQDNPKPTDGNGDHETTEEGQGKWWIQDRFTRNR